MTCDETEILLHALIDGELDAGHARDVETHVAACPACAEKLRAFRAMREAFAQAPLKEAAPAYLRNRIEAALAVPAAAVSAPRQSWLASARASFRESWKNFFGGFAVGTALSAAVAASLVIAVVRNDQNQQIAGDIVSAHLRSLQAGHLTDVISTDQHTVKPWFNGKLDVAPPVIDLTAQGFTLIGGRLDYVDARPIGAIVYRRRAHIINLFVAQTASTERRPAKIDAIQGFNIRSWSDRGLNYWAVSDIAADELAEFGEKFEASMPTGTAG
jgi:anti-sigma factor RsiW